MSHFPTIATRAVLLASSMLLLVPAGRAAEGKPTRLAADGKALHSVIVAEKAAPRVQQAARTLADYLGRISGGKFDVATGDGLRGIAVGRGADFPALPFKLPWTEQDPTTNEDYLLRSHAGGVYLIGKTELAVEHAVWDLLYRLGHRQFFPGAHWEVVPRDPSPAIAVDRFEHPSYHARRIWYGYGPWDYAEKPYAEWCARNRAVSGIELRSGHAYDGIINRNKTEFAAHPEYLGLVNGERKSSKFCISNPDLRKLVVNDALNQFAKEPSLQSVSVDPSDGLGWCECPKCKALASVSDRALTLANEVAEAVNQKHPGKYVGMYAYSGHSPPPSIKAHPRVIISVATAFISGGYTVDQLMAGWQKQGATIGVREYYSVNTWDRDLPGAARGTRLDYIQKTIPHFHAQGARFFSSESSDNWGPNGLGYYVASRILWDVKEAERVNALRADFLERAFGAAREPMAEFYRMLDGSNRSLMSDDLLGRLYRLLADARKLTTDPAVHQRLDDLVLYVRYVELFSVYSTAQGPARQQAFEELIRHTYRMRTSMMVHSKALYRDLAARDKSVAIPREATWNVPEGKNPWKSSQPFGRAELDGLVSTGIETRKLLDFRPVSFGDKLLPAAPLRLPEAPGGSMGIYSRGVRDYLTWIEKPGSISFQASAGRVYQSRGDAKLALYPAAEPEGKAVAQAAVTPDRQEHDVVLKTTFTGLHRLEVSDSGAGTAVTWPDGLPLTLRSSPDAPAVLHGRWSLYFYVPKGTTVVGGYSSGVGTLLDGSGKKVHTFDSKPGYFSIPVESGQDGKLWKFQQCAGQRLLMTVPPYLARSGKELLLPAEVVEKDSPR